MFKILSRSSGNVIGIRAEGLLTHADYQQVLPELEQMIKDYGAIRVLLEITGIPCVTPRALMDDLQFDMAHNKEVERVAITGNCSANEWMTKMTTMLFPESQVLFFDLADADKAWDWIEEGVEGIQTVGSSATEQSQ